MRAAVGLALALLLAACDREPLHREEAYVFGTLVEIQTWGVDDQRAHAAIADVFADFQVMHSTWHAWQPGALARVNAGLKSGAWFSAPPSVLPLIERSVRIARASDGLFNPAIGRLIAAWGFHRDDLPTAPPPRADVEALLRARPRMTDIEIDGIRIRSRNPAVQLDLGAIAKGYAVDLGIARLRAAGIENAIVNAGGDLRAIGRKGERAWRIGIRHPRTPGVLAAVEVQGDECVFTSGDYERFFDHDGKHYHHIIDPRTGAPSRGTTSATVIHGDGAEADAAATALLIAGPQDWYRIARQMGIRYAMLVGADGTVYMNPEMAKRVHFETEPPPTVILSAPL